MSVRAAKLAVEGLELGPSNGLVAAMAPDLPAEVTSLRVGKLELCLSSRAQLGLRLREVSVELAPYELGSRAQHYARLRRRVDARAAHAREVMARQDDLEAEQRFRKWCRDSWWYRQVPIGLYTVQRRSRWRSALRALTPRCLHRSPVRRLRRGKSFVFAWFDWGLGKWTVKLGVSMAAVALAGSQVASGLGASPETVRETARTAAKAVAATAATAAVFADTIAAAILDRVHVQVDGVEVSLTDASQRTVLRATCEQVRWQRLSKPSALARRSFWQRWVWSAYGPLPSVHGLSVGAISVRLDEDGENRVEVTVAPMTLEASAMSDYGAARVHLDTGLPKLDIKSKGFHHDAARTARGLADEFKRGSKTMQYGLQWLWTPQESVRRRWHHAIFTVLTDCQRRAGKSTLATALRWRGAEHSYKQRRARRLWQYALRCAKIELLRASYTPQITGPASIQMPRGEQNSSRRANVRTEELEGMDLDELKEEALAAGVEQSRLELAEEGLQPEDAVIALLLGAEQASSSLRSEFRVSIQVDSVEMRMIELGDEEISASFSARDLRGARTTRLALGFEYPSIASECSIGKLACTWNSLHILRTSAHPLTARSSNFLEASMNSAKDVSARIGAIRINMTPHALNTTAAMSAASTDYDAPEWVATLVSTLSQEYSIFGSDVLQLYSLEDDAVSVRRETRRLHHRHRRQVDVKADLPVINLGSDDGKSYLDVNLGRLHAGNVSRELRGVLTGAARLDSNRFDAIGCKWDGASATFVSKTIGGSQPLFTAFGGTASLQICALPPDQMWAQHCPRLQLSCNLRTLNAQAKLSTLDRMVHLASDLCDALDDAGALDGARGDVVEEKPVKLGIEDGLDPRYDEDDMPPPRWCLRHVEFEPRAWHFSLLHEKSEMPMVDLVFDVDKGRLQEFNTRDCNVDLEVTLSAHAYNSPVVAWEPVIEPWAAKLTSLSSGEETKIRFHGEELNVNLSPSLVQSLNLGRPSESGRRIEAAEGEQAQTWLVNRTGAAFRYKSVCEVDEFNQYLDFDQRATREQYAQLPHGGRDLLELTTPAIPGVSFDQGLLLEFPDMPWHDIEWPDVSREGTQSQVVKGSMAGTTIVCVTEVREDGSRVITLCSGIKVVNQTGRTMEFGLRRRDIVGELDDATVPAMEVPAEGTSFFPASLWGADLQDETSAQLVVFRTVDERTGEWTSPLDIKHRIAADGAQLVVCDDGTDYRFTCCMMCTPGYAAAGKLSVITLFNTLDVENTFEFPVELQFFEDQTLAEEQSAPPCTAGTEHQTRTITVDPGAREPVPDWDPQKDAWMAVADCEGGMSERVCVYRAQKSADQSLACDLILRGGRFATAGLQLEDGPSKLSTEAATETASSFTLRLQYAAQGAAKGVGGIPDASHLVMLGCAYAIVNTTSLPLVVRSRHGKIGDRDVVAELPAYEYGQQDVAPLPFASHGAIEIGVRSGRAPAAADASPDDMILHIVGANSLRRGLMDIISQDIPDPYVVVAFTPNGGDMEQIGRTVAIDNSVDPVWNERFMVRVPPDGGVLSMKVVDYDRWSSDDSMGTAKIDLQHRTAIPRTSQEVLGLGGVNKGSLVVELLPATDSPPLPEPVWVRSWGSRVVSTIQKGAQMNAVSLGVEDVGVAMVPASDAPGATQVITIAPRYRLANLSKQDLLVAIGSLRGNQLLVGAGQTDDVFGLTAGNETLFFRPDAEDDAWSRAVVIDVEESDPSLDTTRITCGSARLNLCTEAVDGTVVITVRPGTPALVVQNLAMDAVWIARDASTGPVRTPRRPTRKRQRAPRRSKLEWIMLGKTEEHAFYEWDWNTEGKVKLKTTCDEYHTVDVTALTDTSTDGWRWTPTKAGEVAWPQVLVLNNTRTLRLGKTAVRPTPPIVSNFELDVSVPRVGLSIVGTRATGGSRELLYASLQDVAVRQARDSGRTTTDLIVGKVQVDEYICAADEPDKRDVILGPSVSGSSVHSAAMLHVHSASIYQPGASVFEVLSAKVAPMFLNLRWSSLSQLLLEPSVQQVCKHMMQADWRLPGVARRARPRASKTLIQSLQMDPISLAVKFEMGGCIRDANLLELVGLERYAKYLSASALHSTEGIRTSRILLTDIFYEPRQVLFDVVQDVGSLFAARLVSSTAGAVEPVESALAVHQKAGLSRGGLKRSFGQRVPDEPVQATMPPLLDMMEMVSKVVDTAPGRRADTARELLADRLYPARWPRVFSSHGVLRKYSLEDIVLWKLLRKSGCCEARELEDGCLAMIAVAAPENPMCRSLMLLTNRTILFAKPASFDTLSRTSTRLHNPIDVGSLEFVVGSQIGLHDVQETEMRLADGELYLRLSGSERVFVTQTPDYPTDPPLETDYKLAEFYKRMTDAVERVRVEAARLERFGDVAGPPRTLGFQANSRDEFVGSGPGAAGCVELTVHGARWWDMQRDEERGEQPHEWFCELQVGKHKPRRLQAGRPIKFEVGGGPTCVVVLKSATDVGERPIGFAKLRLDGSIGMSTRPRWWGLSALPSSAEMEGVASVELSIDYTPKVEETLLSRRDRNKTMFAPPYETCVVLHVEIPSIRLPDRFDHPHGETLVCTLDVLGEDRVVEEKETTVLVSSCDTHTEARGLQPVLFDLTELPPSAEDNVLRVRLLLDDGYVACEKLIDFPGAQPGWSLLHDPTAIDEDEEDEAYLRRRGDIDVSLRVDAIRRSWEKIPDLSSEADLLEDSAAPLVDYRVKLWTGKHWDAGTTASVWVQLVGSKGHSARIPLPMLDEGLPPGCDGTYEIRATNVGKLRRLRIGHDNTGPSPAWLLESACVKRLYSSDDLASSSDSDDEDDPTPEHAVDGVVFPCGEWFGRPAVSKLSDSSRRSSRFEGREHGFVDDTYRRSVSLSRELLAAGMDEQRLVDDYEVTVTTGRVGTAGQVSIALSGDDGDSGACELLAPGTLTGRGSRPQREFLEHGVGTFAVETYSLGKLRHITLSLSAVDRTKPSLLPTSFFSSSTTVGRGGLNGQDDKRDAHRLAIEKQLTEGWMCEHICLHNKRTMQGWSLPIHALLSSANGCSVSRTVELGPPQQIVVYRVSVCTGDEIGAGTDAAVSLRMVGERGQSGLLRLQRSPVADAAAAKQQQDGHADLFERGQTDEFELEIPDIGAVSAIELSHDGRGVGSGWYVDEVLVERVGTLAEATKAAAHSPSFGFTKYDDASALHPGHASRRTRRGGRHSDSDSSSDSDDDSGLRKLRRPPARPGRCTTPFNHDLASTSAAARRQRRLRRGFRAGSSRRTGLRWASAALQPEQTRFLLREWVEETPVQKEVELEEIRTTAAARHSVRWLVTVKTGGMEGAATSANVTLELRGTGGDGGRHTLPRRRGPLAVGPFEGPWTQGAFVRGAESVFALRTAEIGNLSEIVVSHDNAGFSPSWFLEWIELIDEGTGVHWHFPCEHWIGGGGREEKSFAMRDGGFEPEGALFRSLTPLECGMARRVGRDEERAEDTLGTVLVRRLRLLDPADDAQHRAVGPGNRLRYDSTKLSLSRRQNYFRLTCGARGTGAHVALRTSVSASRVWTAEEQLQIRVGNAEFGKAALRLDAMAKEKTLGVDASLVMQGLDKPSRLGSATVDLSRAFPAAFGDRGRFSSLAGVHHAVYDLEPPADAAQGPTSSRGLRVEVQLVFLPNRCRAEAEWLDRPQGPQLRHSVPDEGWAGDEDVRCQSKDNPVPAACF